MHKNYLRREGRDLVKLEEALVQPLDQNKQAIAKYLPGKGLLSAISSIQTPCSLQQNASTDTLMPQLFLQPSAHLPRCDAEIEYTLHSVGCCCFLDTYPSGSPQTHRCYIPPWGSIAAYRQLGVALTLHLTIYTLPGCHRLTCLRTYLEGQQCHIHGPVKYPTADSCSSSSQE